MFVWELRKVWTKEHILLIAAVTLLFSLTFLVPPIRSVTVTEEGEEIFSARMGIIKEWLNKYDTQITPQEFEEIKRIYDERLSDGQAVISTQPYFAENNVFTYDDYLSYGNNALNGAEGYSYDSFRKMREFISEGTDYSAMYYQEYEDLIHKYVDGSSRKARYIETLLSGKAEKAAISELDTLRRTKGVGSLLPGELVYAANRYYVNLSILLIILAMFISGPVMVNDNANNIRPGQYSSKIGLKIYQRQYAAMAVSLSALTALMLIGSLTLWLAVGAGRFFQCGIFAFQMMETPVTGDLSFGVYLVLISALIFILVNGVGGLMFYLSGTSRNFIEMLMKSIPAAVFGIMLSLSLNDLFLNTNFLFRMTGIRGVEIFPVILIFIFGLLINLKGIR